MKSAFLAFLVMGTVVSASELPLKNYIITETGKFTSLDPLDADQTQNLPVARMLYSTPVELDSADNLKSSVLDTFSYDVSKRVLVWKLRSGVKFSDGSAITTRDVELAVTRMILARPDFPVIDKIEGVSEWIKTKNPLETRPKGVTTNTNEIRIQFSSNVDHPLVRFTLELFSVIPAICIDLKTNKVSCKSIPSSGPYTIDKEDSESIEFSLRADYKNTESAPRKIRFRYMAAPKFADSFSTLDSNAVVASNQVLIEPSILGKLDSSGKLVSLPAARFAALLINPTVKPFDNKSCRTMFAEKFREQFAQLGKGQISTESSIFTKLLPGYMTTAELSASAKIKSDSECEKHLRSSEIKWGYVSSEKNLPFVAAMDATLRSLKIQAKAVEFENRKAVADAFSEGSIAFLGVSSGFWAFDPAGDLQMLFTPNLHKQLKFLSEDSQLQKLIAEAKTAKTNEAFKAVNSYLYSQGLFNVYNHTKRFYWSSNPKLLKDVNFGNTAPAPWQVFQ